MTLPKFLGMVTSATSVRNRSGNASMPLKLSKLLKDKPSDSAVAPTIREYEDRLGTAKRGGLESRKSDYKKFNDLYYDLATDFYEYGWGSSFHFARRVPGESFKAALVRHEHHFANALGLKPKISGTHGQLTRGQSDWVW